MPRDPSAASGFGQGDDLVFAEPLYSVGTGNNPEYDTCALQVVFESMVTPLGWHLEAALVLRPTA